jgi:UDP-3-O-[3-hydroxymyristoyl] glucosamine N-acyltransferase
MNLTLADIAAKVGGELIGEPSTKITGFAAAENARPGDLTFAEKPAYFSAAESSQASAIIVSGVTASSIKPLIVVSNARVAVARLLPLLFPLETFSSSIDPTAVVDATAQVDPSAHIGPLCVVGPRVRIGANAVLMGGNQLRRDCEVGEHSVLHSNVVLYPGTQVGKRVIIHAGTVIGSDGYGYVFDQGSHRKMLQLGQVIIEDDVEIGANSAIDRGALGPTIIGKGTKIDNLVHVAHNVVMGKHCLVMGQVGFAGSTVLGDYCVIASQSGIAGHLKIGNQATVGAKSGVMRDVPDGTTVVGIPAAPDKQTKRQWVGVMELPELLKRVRKLEQEMIELRSRGPQ